MPDFLKGLGIIFGSVLLVAVAIFVFGFIPANIYGRYACENYARITGKETRYANFDECYVKTAQGFQRWDEYKARALASEGLGANTN